MPFVAKTHQGGWEWAADVGAACSSQVQLSFTLAVDASFNATFQCVDG